MTTESPSSAPSTEGPASPVELATSEPPRRLRSWLVWLVLGASLAVAATAATFVYRTMLAGPECGMNDLRASVADKRLTADWNFKGCDLPPESLCTLSLSDPGLLLLQVGIAKDRTCSLTMSLRNVVFPAVAEFEAKAAVGGPKDGLFVALVCPVGGGPCRASKTAAAATN